MDFGPASDGVVCCFSPVSSLPCFSLPFTGRRILIRVRSLRGKAMLAIKQPTHPPTTALAKDNKNLSLWLTRKKERERERAEDFLHEIHFRWISLTRNALPSFSFSLAAFFFFLPLSQTIYLFQCIFLISLDWVGWLVRANLCFFGFFLTEAVCGTAWEKSVDFDISFLFPFLLQFFLTTLHFVLGDGGGCRMIILNVGGGFELWRHGLYFFFVKLLPFFNGLSHTPTFPFFGQSVRQSQSTKCFVL